MVFDYRARMLPVFSFTAPSGATFDLQFDKLEREGGKKSSVNEILDSDNSVIQDQGGKPHRYPVEGYFTGDSYDLQADGFFTALSERYSQLIPGLLVHPRWGTISVFPIKWKQSESFVSGQRRANFTVEFVRVYPPNKLFQAIGLAVSQVVGLVTILGKLDVQKFIDDIPLAVQAIGDTIGAGLNTVKGSVDKLLNTHIDLRDIANSIFLEAEDLLSDPGENADLLIGQVQLMQKLPMELEDETFSKINAYDDIVSKIIVETSNVGDISDPVRKNKAIVLERLAGYAVAVQNAGALSTIYQTRSSAISAIETLKNTYDSFTDALQTATVESTLEFSFSGDHEFLSTLHDIYTRTAAILLENAFSLSGEVTVVLSEKSDPVTLCYQYYKKIDNETLQFFFDSNQIDNPEFIELDVGREVVFYV